MIEVRKEIKNRLGRRASWTPPKPTFTRPAEKDPGAKNRNSAQQATAENPKKPS